MIFKAGPEAGHKGERRGFSWQSHTLVMGGRGGVWQSQMLVVGRKKFGSHGGETGILMEVPNDGFGGGEAGFSWQSQMLFVGVETGVLMGVPDMVVGEDRLGFSWQSQMLVVGVFSWQL